ncbi:hypothetical protein BGZ73_005703 [Actinomortierella ambigua]|nr:hypothetical protein BGZ73_005703 [Actinomortierella ambigua]
MASDWYTDVEAQGQFDALLHGQLKEAEGRRALESDADLGHKCRDLVELFHGAELGGDMEAQLVLANINDVYRGVPCNSNHALYWSLQAAHGGNAAAQYKVGTIHKIRAESSTTDDSSIIGNSESISLSYYSYHQAVYWFREASLQGHTWAQYDLGNLLKDGKGAEQDYVEAASWFQKLPTVAIWMQV